MATREGMTEDESVGGAGAERARLIPRAAFKFVFATLLAAVAFAATYTSSSAAFSDSDLGDIILLGGTVNTGLLLPTLFLLRSKVMANVALSLIVMASMATAYVIHTDLYRTGNEAVIIALCAGSGAGLFVAFELMDKQRWCGPVFSASALLGLGLTCGGWWGGGGGIRAAPTLDATYIQDISLRETPNLYFVSFDALTPRSLLKKYLDLETTKFHDLFDAGFRRFPNFFANAIPTRESLNTVLALDVDAYSSQREKLRAAGDDPDPHLFSGRNPSNLLGILHRNGYESTSIYVDSYLGEVKGQYIDNYITIHGKTVCNLLDEGIRDFSFWGYCRFESVSWHAALDLSAEQITKARIDAKSQFVMAHLYSPGHTDQMFRYDNAEQLDEFRAMYIDSIERAAGYLELIIRHLDENDRGAILLVYGDHGLYLSRGQQFEESPEFVFQDNYGILGGIYPRDTCASWFDKAQSQGYMTTLDAVHALLRCLSGGESPLVEPKKYKQPWNEQMPLHERPHYKDFLYE